MGVSNSRLEEDKALQLCRERKRFVKQALNGRCSLAAAHINYIQSLRSTGVALGKFVEPEATIESSLYTSTTFTPEPLALTEKSISSFSFSPSRSQHVSHVDAAQIFSPSPSPPNSDRFQANYMKNHRSSTNTVEETPFPITRTLRSSKSTPLDRTPCSPERPGSSEFNDHHHLSPENPPWDYFGTHPIDSQFSFQDGRRINHDHGFHSFDDLKRFIDEEGVPDSKEDEEKVAFIGKEDVVESEESENEFDEPSTENLVRSFQNRRVLGSQSSISPTMPSPKSLSSEVGVFNEKKINSPDLTPLKTTESVVTPPSYEKKASKLLSKDFLSSIKEIERLFVKASESGREVPRMLEANKMHFRPIFPGKEGVSRVSVFCKACFSCGEDPTHVPEEPAPTAIKYLTWHRTTSSHSSSSRNPLAPTSKDDIEDLNSNIFESICMNSGSHVSTLDRLHAWERKLYDEVKASGHIRRDYDAKCRLLRHQESRNDSPKKVDETRAVVKDLHSRIRVAIHRIDSISKRIEELRDKELQPQLEELIAGLRRMWEIMFECHELQFKLISAASHTNGSTKSSIHSESHRQATINLEHELSILSSSFTKWVNSQKSYVRSIDGWLHKCVSLRQKTSRRRRRLPDMPLRDLGPPIFVTSGVWLDKLETLPTKELSDSIKVLETATVRLLPRQEKKNHGKNLNSLKAVNGIEGADSIPRNELPEDWISGYDNFRSSLVGFLDRLNKFASASVNMYVELEKAIQEAKRR